MKTEFLTVKGNKYEVDRQSNGIFAEIYKYESDGYYFFDKIEFEYKGDTSNNYIKKMIKKLDKERMK